MSTVRRVFLAAVLLCHGGGPFGATVPPDDDAARGLVERFGQALRTRDVSLLSELLPREGKVQLRLVRMGRQEGFFSSDQVRALLADFLARGSVRAFETLQIEHDPQGVLLARARASLTDADGRDAGVELRLVFRAENERWALREIRETPP